MSCEFKVITNPKHNGGSFNLVGEGIIEIGTECIKEDPGYTFMLICHEIAEVIHVTMRTRYDDPSVSSNYKFFMDHKEFENHTRVFADTIQKFIK